MKPLALTVVALLLIASGNAWIVAAWAWAAAR